MISRVQVRASTNEISRYRKLVDSEWNKATFEAVLDLLWDVVRASSSEHKESTEVAFLRQIHEKKRTTAVPPEFVNRLRFLSTVFRDPNVPPMPKEFAAGASRLTAQSGATAVCLLLQISLKIMGEAGFFRDLQSLLYLTTVHYLLPKLQADGSQGVHDSLVNALVIHAFLVWRDEPSHMFYLLGAMMGHLGHEKARLDFLDRALSATPVDDHSYLTKVSAYWGELLELGENDAAMDFLVRLNRNVPESYVAEIAEMITETAELHVRRGGETSGPQKMVGRR